MPWATSRGKRGTHPKYRTRQHRQLSEQYKRQVRAGHVLTCTAARCVMSSRAITNPNGMDPDGVTVGHNDDGVTYAGPQHRRCNVLDGARRGSLIARGLTTVIAKAPRRWEL